MKIQRKNNSLPRISLCMSLLLMLLVPAALAAESSRVDKKTLELNMASRIESMLEKLIGQNRCLVKVNLDILDPTQEGTVSVKSSLRGIPTIVFPEANKEANKTAPAYSGATIKSMSIMIYLDKALSEDKVELVKTTVPKWLELDYNRGDSLKIESIPLQGGSSTDDIAAKQLSFLQKNFLVIIGIAAVIILGFLLFVLLFLSIKKFIKQTGKAKPQETGQTPDFNKVLQGLKDTLTGTPSQNVDTLLEDIKEILAKSPASKMDSFLEDIKETLEKIAKGQFAAAAAGAGVTTQVTQPGVAASAGPMPQGLPGQDFLAALKEAITPAVVAGGGGGMGASPELLGAMRSIEELMKKQIETTSTGSKALDEPFKYLNTLSSKEIPILIEGENSRISAIALGHIDPEKAATILAILTEEQQVEISLAMASLVETEEVATELKDFLQRKMPMVKLRSDFAPISGNKNLADILSSLPYNVVTSVLNNMDKQNATLAKTVRKEMFMFDDIAGLGDEVITELLKGVALRRLAMALSIAAENVKEKFYKTMPEGMRSRLKEESETLRLVTYKEGSPKEILIFEDIANLDNTTITEILRIIDRGILKIALKATSEDIRQKFYSVMTERGAAILREDIEVMAAIPHLRSEEEQKKILDKIHELENECFVAQQEIIAKIKVLEMSGRITLAPKEKE